MPKEGISVTQWIQWLGATVAAGIVLTSFVYMTFDTKSDAQARASMQDQKLDKSEAQHMDQIREMRSEMNRRFDALDNKVDRILTNDRSRRSSY